MIIFVHISQILKTHFSDFLQIHTYPPSDNISKSLDNILLEQYDLIDFTNYFNFNIPISGDRRDMFPIYWVLKHQQAKVTEDRRHFK